MAEERLEITLHVYCTEGNDIDPIPRRVHIGLSETFTVGRCNQLGIDVGFVLLHVSFSNKR